MKSYKILVTLMLIFLFAIGLVPTIIFACTCDTPRKQSLFPLLALGREQSYKGSCNFTEKNYCIENRFIDVNMQTSFCTLSKGSFSLNGKCLSNSVGKCKVADEHIKFYYSPILSTSAKSDCDKIAGIFTTE